MARIRRISFSWVILLLLCLPLLRCDFEGFTDDHIFDDEDQVAPRQVSHPGHSAKLPRWDEDEFEGFSTEPDDEDEGSAQEDQPLERNPRKFKFVHQEHYYFELAAVVCLLLYTINIFIGKKGNEKVAIAWAKAFATPNSILDKNFSLLGPGDTPNNELLMRESNSTFKFYASGRRHCESLVATIDCRARHDLLRLASYLAVPRTDIINIEVQMNEGSMPQIVLAVGVPDIIKNLPKQYKDIATFTKRKMVPKNRLAYWPGEQLHVLTEHSSVFYDIFTDPRIESVFSGPSDLSLFRFLHFTSEQLADGGARRLLRFSFSLPPPDQIQQLARLMAIVPVFIDVLGGYRMAAEVSKKAAKARAEVAEKEAKEKQAQRQEAVQQQRRALKMRVKQR